MAHRSRITAPKARCLGHHEPVIIPPVAGEDSTLQVLDLLRRELRAASVYLEFGGTPRLEPTVVSHALDEHWRVVAVFNETPPADARERLSALLAAFASARPSLTPIAQRLGRPPAERRLDEELVRLRELLGAQVVLIIDESSPVLWGASALRGHGIDVDFLVELAEVIGRFTSEPKDWDLAGVARGLGQSPGEREHEPTARELELEKVRAWAPELEPGDWYLTLLCSLAVAPFRERKHKEARGRRIVQPPPIGYVAQPLSSQYVLLFVFDQPFSQLHAEATAVHAVPYLEKLIQDLPPIDPEGGAKAARRPSLKLV